MKGGTSSAGTIASLPQKGHRVRCQLSEAMVMSVLGIVNDPPWRMREPGTQGIGVVVGRSNGVMRGSPSLWSWVQPARQCGQWAECWNSMDPER